MRISDGSSDVSSADQNGLTQDIARIRDSEGRLGHPREARKFVDHAPHVMNLPDHRIGKLAEGRRIALDLVAKAALEPFGGKLDRRQRILDFMRDTPRDVGPGSAALIEQLLRHVLETEAEIGRASCRERVWKYV